MLLLRLVIIIGALMLANYAASRQVVAAGLATLALIGLPTDHRLTGMYIIDIAVLVGAHSASFRDTKDQWRRKKSHRQRQIDLPNAASLPDRNLFDC